MEPHRFTRICRFASIKLWRVNLRVQLFVLQSIVYDQMEEKSSNRLTATLLKNCRLENIGCSKYQFIFVTAALRVLILLKDNAFGCSFPEIH